MENQDRYLEGGIGLLDIAQTPLPPLGGGGISEGAKVAKNSNVPLFLGLELGWLATKSVTSTEVSLIRTA